MSRWYPSGICYLPQQNTLFVANYPGHDVLIFDYSQNRLNLLLRITHPLMISPEGLCVSPDGTVVYVADFDGHCLFAFSIATGTELWHVDVSNAHALCCNKDYVYTASLHDKQIRKYALDGTLLTSSGTIGWGPNEYLWPISLLLYDNDIVVSDAHTGRISFLNESLQTAALVWRQWTGSELIQYALRYCL